LVNAVGFNVDLGSRSGVDFPGDAKKLHSLGKKYDNKSSKHSADRISIKHSSRAIGEAELEALLSLSTPSGAASPSQPYLTRTPVPLPLLLTTHGLPKSMLHYFHPPCQMQLNSSIIKKALETKEKGKA